MNEQLAKEEDAVKERNRRNKDMKLQHDIDEKVIEKLGKNLRRRNEMLQKGKELLLENFIEFSKLVVKILNEDSFRKEDLAHFPEAIKAYKESGVETEDLVINEKVAQLGIMATNFQKEVNGLKGAIFDISKQ
eukprot:TRINITY_DN14371_c0_g9_i1.p2 TRINITY_DN14371_c0_g9~~TRINITY_DN14371_c0_g9_i1.p2  ORF type:complete len:133 (-),score=46.46 TRINITY_DN14371_c0_g9_i1:90-488(-)